MMYSPQFISHPSFTIFLQFSLSCLSKPLLFHPPSYCFHISCLPYHPSLFPHPLVLLRSSCTVQFPSSSPSLSLLLSPTPRSFLSALLRSHLGPSRRLTSAFLTSSPQPVLFCFLLPCQSLSFHVSCSSVSQPPPLSSVFIPLLSSSFPRPCVFALHFAYSSNSVLPFCLSLSALLFHLSTVSNNHLYLTHLELNPD